jgi:hypothetical protein
MFCALPRYKIRAPLTAQNRRYYVWFFGGVVTGR